MASYFQVTQNLLEVAKKSNRDPLGIRLLAVSKTKSIEQITQIYDLGQRDFAENYVDELVQKATALSSLGDIQWSFIGQLQSNKISKIVEFASEIQTVATQKHARYINRIANELGKKKYPIWLHINADNESSKFGIKFEDAIDLKNFIEESCPFLRLKGIMSIPPEKYSDKNYPEIIPELYLKLRCLADTIGERQLSLGMSNDLALAIRSGSNCVRIGTAIFGARESSK